MSIQPLDVFDKAYSAVQCCVSDAEYGLFIKAIRLDDERSAIASLLDKLCNKYSMAPGELATLAIAWLKHNICKANIVLSDYDDTDEQQFLKHLHRLSNKYGLL